MGYVSREYLKEKYLKVKYDLEIYLDILNDDLYDQIPDDKVKRVRNNIKNSFNAIIGELEHAGK